MTKGLLYSHQGWTDIINCLPLINYYANKYSELLFMVREDAKPFIDYYIKGLDNVQVVYVSKQTLDTNNILPPYGIDILYHGFHDRNRTDIYNGAFEKSSIYFAQRFYECYGISFMEKVNLFSIQRDLNIEEQKYQGFISEHGMDYILFHDDQNTPGGETGINLNDVLSQVENKVNLNGITKNVFDFIKVIENAKEIHLVDSIWAATCYLLDAKYGFFKDKTINLYSFKSRSGGLIHNHGDVEIIPYHPKNWIVKSI